MREGDAVENVSKFFDDLMAILDETKQDDPNRDILKQEILDFLNKELLEA